MVIGLKFLKDISLTRVCRIKLENSIRFDEIMLRFEVFDHAD